MKHSMIYIYLPPNRKDLEVNSVYMNPVVSENEL